MSSTYSWVISSLDCYPEQDGKQDVVFTVYWRRQVTDNNYTADVYGSQVVTLDPAAPFTPYSQLTQTQVENWLVDAMGAAQVAAIDASLAEKIKDLAHPPVITLPLPWA